MAITTVPFPDPFPARQVRGGWELNVDGVAVSLSNLDKPYWRDEGYTKGDLVGYYYNAARWILPYLRDRPLTLKRMPDGAGGEYFYAKRAPDYTPDWMATAPVVSLGDGKRIDYLLAQSTAGLVWLANAGCIEMHPWHSRVDDIGRPDYAFFDLDPFDVSFATVREVALLVGEAVRRLGLRAYPRTSGATGIQIYVPIDRVHSAGAVRRWVERVCRLVHRADPERTTMEWAIKDRTGRVYLDFGMNTEGKNIASAYSLRPEPGAPVATPLEWDELATDVEPQDFTIASVWERLQRVGDLHAPVIAGGQDLRAAMEAVGVDPDTDDPPSHRIAERDEATPGTTPEEALARYRARRDFDRTPEPAPSPETAGAEDGSPRFVIHHHLATRLHHDLRLAHEGVAPSWAVPKGLPDVPGLRHLAVQTEDHPIDYMTFEGEIPEGEYGAGPVRIWDDGTYETVEWRDGKVSVRLHGRRHDGEFHLFRTSDEDPSQWMVVRVGDPEPLPDPPPELRPMLATDGGGQGFDDPAWRFEVKWDGIRVIATAVRPGTGEPGSTRLVSRAGNALDAAYPELAALWERVLARNAVLDGEIVAFDDQGRPSFQRLQQRMHVRGERALQRMRREIPVTLMVFDVLAVDGESLCDLPLEDRVRRLADVVVPGAHVRLSDGVVGDGVAFFEAARQHGLEGLIAKRLSSPYRSGARSLDWRKLKVRHRADCVIGGWMPGAGGRSGHLGSLLVGCYTDAGLRYIGRVGTGFDEDELRRLEGLLKARVSDAPPFDAEGPALPRGARWVRPELVCSVEYGETTNDGVLRAASYKGLVGDVDPHSCVIEDLLRNLT